VGEPPRQLKLTEGHFLATGDNALRNHQQRRQRDKKQHGKLTCVTREAKKRMREVRIGGPAGKKRKNHRKKRMHLSPTDRGWRKGGPLGKSP